MAVRLAGRAAARLFFAVGAATVEDELACGFLGLGEVAEAGGGAGVFGGGLLASATGSGGPRTGSARISGRQRLGGRWALVAAAPVHGAAPSPDPRGSGRCAQGRAQWRLRRPRAGLFLFLAIGSVGGVHCSGAAGSALARAAWGSAGQPAVAVVALASARAGAGRWRGLLFPPPLPPFLLDLGVEAATPAGDTGSGATATSGAPGAGGGIRGGACA